MRNLRKAILRDWRNVIGHMSRGWGVGESSLFWFLLGTACPRVVCSCPFSFPLFNKVFFPIKKCNQLLLTAS